MPAFGEINWHDIFLPDRPVLEIIIRGSAVYLALFLMLRFVLKRQSGTVGVTDLLLIVLIADAAQNAMSAQYKSLPDGLILVATIVFWNYALDWLGYRFVGFRRLIHPPPLELIRDGRVNRRNLRNELITQEELEEQLREQGIDDVRHVARAYMEGDGKLSVVKIDKEQHPKRRSKSN